MKKVGGTSPGQLICDKKMACEINKVLDSISDVAITNKETECQNKLNAIKEIISKSPNTRSMEEICKVIEGKEGGKSKSKSKSKTKKKKKNYKKKTKTRSKTRRKNKRKGNKRRKTYKKKK